MNFDIMFINYCFIYFTKHKVKVQFKKKLKLLFLMTVARKMQCSSRRYAEAHTIADAMQRLTP